MNEDAPAIVHVHGSQKMHYASAARDTSSLCKGAVVGMTMLPHHYFARQTDEYEWCEKCLERLRRLEFREIVCDTPAERQVLLRQIKREQESKWRPGGLGRIPKWYKDLQETEKE